MIPLQVSSSLEITSLNDGLSSFNDVETDLESISDQFLALRDNILASAENLAVKGFSAALSDEISIELANVRAVLSSVECCQLYIDELLGAKEYIAAHADHRNVEVLRYCLQQLGRYISELALNKQEHFTLLVSGFNEMSAMEKRPLISEMALTVPAVFQIKFEQLQQFHDDTADATAVDGVFNRDECYLEFSQLVLSIYRGQNRTKNLQRLNAFFERLEQYSIDAKAQAFWAANAAYVESINVSAGELRPAVFKIFKQIEKMVMAVLASDHSPVLGIQTNVDQLQCNLLCALVCDSYQGDCLPRLETEFELASVVRIFESHLELEIQGSEAWLHSSAKALRAKLQAQIALFNSDELQQSQGSVHTLSENTKSLKRLLMLSSVHSARENFQEIAHYLKPPITPEARKSCVTSLELVEQQMLYQFGFLNEAVDTVPRLTAAENIVEAKTTEAFNLPYKKASSPVVNENVDAADFGDKCNSCIDVIQQALDTALGSSGNLMPDNSVVSALNQLINIVEDQGEEELAGLLTPLATFLAEAENTTLNQSETLLVQEAVIAATLGIDSLVSVKPMPDLVADVTDRIEAAMSVSNNRQEGELNQSEFFDGFLNEAEELLPRLYELLQRWRGAPFGSSRLHTEISRLLHSLKHTAEEVNELSIAAVVHYLEATMLDLRHTDVLPSDVFFDLALESIEWLTDDIDRLRNNEAATDSTDLIDRLKLAGAVESGGAGLREPSVQQGTQRSHSTEETTDENPGHVSTDNTHNKEPIAEPGLVLLNDQDRVHALPDTTHQLQRADNSVKSLDLAQAKLVELQKKLAEAASADTNGLAQEQQSLQSLLAELADITQSQTGALHQLGLQLSAVAQVTLESMREPLVKVLSTAAINHACRVQFKFESGGISVHRDLAHGIQQALEPLLSSLVGTSFEATSERIALGKVSLPTIAVSFRQTDNELLIEVLDDGAGVTVHGAEVRNTNPWQQASKAGWQQFDLARGSQWPTAWSNLDDAPIEVSALLAFAASHGATVSVSGNELGSRYSIALPRLVRLKDVMLVELQQQQFAIDASQVSQVSLWSGETALSLADLIGIKRKTAFAAKRSRSGHVLQCRTASGVHSLLVDKVTGHQSLEFSNTFRLLPDVPGYRGAAVVGDQVVKLLDLNHWL